MAKTNTNTNSKSKNVNTKQKTSGRVIFNTCLLALMTIIFGVMTYCGASKIVLYSKNHSAMVASDSPALCFEEEIDLGDDVAPIRNGGYICSSMVDENNKPIRLTDIDDYAMFFSDRISFTATIESVQLEILLCTIGSMLTLASLIGAIIYWNHNRA